MGEGSKGGGEEVEEAEQQELGVAGVAVVVLLAVWRERRGV